MGALAEQVRDLTYGHIGSDEAWQQALDVASEVETLEARLQLVSDLAHIARTATPPDAQEPYWVKAILQAIGEAAK
jgi:hypothetical protein